MFLATVALGLAVVVLWAPTRSALLRVASLMLGAALLVAVASSRVYLGSHWPADVVGGVLAGVAYLGTGMWLFCRTRRTLNEGRS